MQKIARDLSCCSEVNMLVLYQSNQGYMLQVKFDFRLNLI